MNISKLKHFNQPKTALAALTMAMAVAYAPASSAAVTAYQQDHEGLDPADGFALGFVGGEQYGVFADVWFGDVSTGTFLYSYGVFSAPNGGAGFSAIAGGEGGAEQGAQYLNIYSDYGNADHGNSFNINTAVFQEQSIEAGDIGSTVTFQFDYKAPSSCGIAEPSTCIDGQPVDDGTLNGSTASAFIKTLDPLNGFATTNDIRFDSTIEIQMVGLLRHCLWISPTQH